MNPLPALERGALWLALGHVTWGYWFYIRTTYEISSQKDAPSDQTMRIICLVAWPLMLPLGMIMNFCLWVPTWYPNLKRS